MVYMEYACYIVDVGSCVVDEELNLFICSCGEFQRVDQVMPRINGYSQRGAYDLCIVCRVNILSKLDLQVTSGVDRQFQLLFIS